MSDHPTESHCISCGMRLPPSLPESAKTAHFCPYCGNALYHKSSQFSLVSTAWSQENSISLPKGQAPAAEEVKFLIGPYQILSSLGKGGMGEVFLAYDPTCGRRLALKRIREDLSENEQLHHRFLKEARLTSQLIHPSIIPIYTIHISEKIIYYTMPYVEGETLKQILRTTHHQEKKGQKLHAIGGSIPALMRIFMTLCQAVAYAHAEGVLHRDLKPENIMIGRYGEVMILDWGLAKLFDSPEEPLSEPLPGPLLRGATKIGKVVGTATYISPECALGGPASVQSEIYALGVILYQLLTLQTPFGRKTMRDLRKTMDQGVFIDPAEVAPYREVPPMLSQIASKCLAFHLKERYQTVSELLHDLELFLEGRSEWLQTKVLDISNKGDWEFQENVLIAKNLEITRHAEETEWVNLMISRSSFPGNCMLEAKICLQGQGAGVGFLINVPEAAERMHPADGYCLWVSSESKRDTKLLFSTIEVMSAPDTYLTPGTWYEIRIEKIDNNIHFSLNNQLQFSYNSPLPSGGTHIGLISRDMEFAVKDFKVHCGSQNLNVSCLAVPDAFLAHHYHSAALVEYRRIAYSFPGRSVGREALLRAGITLLAQGRTCNHAQQASIFYDAALQEFSKLHNTAGAPLEYLGKALVYQTQEEFEEEIKCFELALRRYHAHPLLHMIQERVIHRLHESSRHHRLSAYHFALLVVCHLPALSHLPNAQLLFSSLQKHWEPLYFLPETYEKKTLQGFHFAIPLAFWVGKPFALMEIIQKLKATDPPNFSAISDALFSLMELGEEPLVRQFLNHEAPHPSYAHIQDALIGSREKILGYNAKKLSLEEARVLIFVMERGLSRKDSTLVHTLAGHFSHAQTTPPLRLLLDSYFIWALLLDKNFADAGHELLNHSWEELSDERNPLYFLYGCFLAATEGKEMAEIHFSGALETTYPRLWSLASHFLLGTISEANGWFQKAFSWEKRHLYRQLSLYFHCCGDPEQSDYYRVKMEM